MTTYSRRSFVVACAIAAGTISLLARMSDAAQATPQFSQQTGLPCSQFHKSGGSSADLTSFGTQFLANGNQLPKPKLRHLRRLGRRSVSAYTPDQGARQSRAA